MLATDGFGKLLIIWNHLTSDGYGSYLPPDEIDPAPTPTTPWPPSSCFTTRPSPPGLDEWHFVQTLLNNDLIDP